MSQPFFRAGGGFGEEPEPAMEPGGKLKRATWLWIIVGVVLAAVVAASVISAVTAPGGGDSTGTDRKAVAASDQPTSQASTSSDPNVAPDNPGEYGKPSLPSNDPLDPMKGAKPIPGVDSAAFKAALQPKWSLDYRSRPTRGGALEIGMAGDLGRKQRRLDAIVHIGSGGAAYMVYCQAGGNEIVPTDDTSLGFVTDCLSQAVHGDDWQQLKSWLDQNLRSMAEKGGKTTFRLPSFQVYAESNGHVMSCVLANL